MALVEPSYVSLYRSGELENRARILNNQLASCDICPRECRVNRLGGELGFCHSGYLPVVSSFCAHRGEEPPLSGINGSGTIFFSNCNMSCIFCQNYQISQDWKRQNQNEIDCHVLAEKMIYLQDNLGCHNINFVSPSHFVPQLVQAVLEAVPMGLKVPLIYNSNAYDSLTSLNLLDGIIDIYLPDLKYADDKWAEELSRAPDYVRNARQAIAEMHRQVGELIIDNEGIAKSGMIVRHLILPNDLAGSEESLGWISKELSPQVTVSVMSQYSPVHLAKNHPLISRTISENEYEKVIKVVSDLGLENGWIQEMESAKNYLPDFYRDGHPFTPSSSE